MGSSSSSLGLVSCGLDWVTLTTTDSHMRSRFQGYFNKVLADERKLGYDAKRGGAYGFYGERTRHALLGHKEEWSMLQISSDQAQNAIDLAKSTSNATRLDIQATIRVEQGAVNSMLEFWCERAREAPATRGIRPKVKAVVGEHGVETVQIGRRASDVFIRCYDKFEESGEECYRDCVRVEAEIKGKTARALWQKLAEVTCPRNYIMEVLTFLLERRGVDVQELISEWEPEPLPLKERTSLERTKGWMVTQVAPAVARMAAEWGWYTPLSVLFDRCLTDRDRTVIMNAWSLAWGD